MKKRIMKKRIKTEIDIYRCWGWQHKRFVIPKGSILRLATNLEGQNYWLASVPPDLKKNKEFRSWHKIYGILIEPDELIHGNQ